MKLIEVTQIIWTEVTNSEDIMLPQEEILQISDSQWEYLKDDPNGDILKKLLGFYYDSKVITLSWTEFYPTDVRNILVDLLDN